MSGLPGIPPDPRDPNCYHRGGKWPSETLRPLVLTPEELAEVREGLAIVASLAWGDPS